MRKKRLTVPHKSDLACRKSDLKCRKSDLACRGENPESRTHRAIADFDLCLITLSTLSVRTAQRTMALLKTAIVLAYKEAIYCNWNI